MGDCFSFKELAKKYVTAAEIAQQPRLWTDTLELFNRHRERVTAFLAGPLAKRNVRVVITGAGTSAYVGEIVAPYLHRTLGIRVESIATTDIVANPQDYFEVDTPTILVSCARSGNSPESVAAYDLAEQCIRELYQVVITCNRHGLLAAKAGDRSNALLMLMPEESNDKGLAMTSSFSCMLLSLLLLFDLEHFADNVWRVRKIIADTQAVVDNYGDDIRNMAAASFERIVYLGSSALKALAREAALKTLELSSGRVTTVYESALGFRHGPKCIVNNQTIVFVLLSGQLYTRQYELDILRELDRERNGYKIAVVGYGNDGQANQMADYSLTVDKVGTWPEEDAYSALAYAVFAQMFAFYNSLKLGNDPDNPRPDGVINRVVQGVIIYPYAN